MVGAQKRPAPTTSNQPNQVERTSHSRHAEQTRPAATFALRFFRTRGAKYAYTATSFTIGYPKPKKRFFCQLSSKSRSYGHPHSLPQEKTGKQLLLYCSSPILEASFTYLNPHVLSGPDRFCRVRPGGVQQTDQSRQRPCPPTICRFCHPQGAEPPVTALVNVGITGFASCGVAQKVTDDLQ